MDPDPLKIIRILKTLPGPNFSNVTHVHVFECYRERKDGGMQKVEVRVFDAGPEINHGRYMCEAIAEGGRHASGNSDNSIDVAIAVVHWGDLDKEPLGG